MDRAGQDYIDAADKLDAATRDFDAMLVRGDQAGIASAASVHDAAIIRCERAARNAGL